MVLVGVTILLSVLLSYYFNPLPQSITSFSIPRSRVTTTWPKYIKAEYVTLGSNANSGLMFSSTQTLVFSALNTSSSRVSSSTSQMHETLVSRLFSLTRCLLLAVGPTTDTASTFTGLKAMPRPYLLSQDYD